MKKILVLGNSRTEKSEDFINLLRNEMDEVQIDHAGLTELHIFASKDSLRIECSRLAQDISSYDFVWFRSWQQHPEIARACALLLKKVGVGFSDVEVGMVQSFSKITEIVALALENIPVVPTYIGPAGSFSEEFFDFPLIVKNPFGRKSRETYIVNSNQELSDFTKKHSLDFLMLEPRVAGELKDYRVLVVDGSVDYVASRKIVEHHGNTDRVAVHGGPLVSPDEFDAEALEIAKKSAKILSRDVAGVDMIFDEEKKPFVIEVNNAPSLQDSSLEKQQLKLDAISRFLSSKLSK